MPLPSLRAWLAACSLFAPLALAADPPACHHDMKQSAATTSDATRYARSVQHYTLPEVTLTDQDGHKVPLAQALPSDRPIAVNFIFTTCTTICPVMSATFNGLQRHLGDAAKDLALVSISIDPEHDRPEALKEYARRFHAPANWRFYTGTSDDIRTVLRAVDAFSGDKANHRAITLLRSAHGTEWIRIEGFPSAAELAGEYHGLVATK